MIESEMTELYQAPNPSTRYSLFNLYHLGMHVFERVATRGHKNVWVYPHIFYIIHTL